MNPYGSLKLPVISVRFEVFMAVKIEFLVFWLVELHSVVVGYQHFGGLHCLHTVQCNNPENRKFSVINITIMASLAPFREGSRSF
jgi:hypothetical protein